MFQQRAVDVEEQCPFAGQHRLRFLHDGLRLLQGLANHLLQRIAHDIAIRLRSKMETTLSTLGGGSPAAPVT
ncbi:hypothetical protein, partial [Mesorhizobium sp. M7A.F.Ca.ET.027.03.2.1]|uniref:hypothetical protein n=1 Tax=Mesorhizobium sp. M7A.F.Ca.ET.027.03.2.1 TaxID=2496656 RepID=UPI001AEC7B20